MEETNNKQNFAVSIECVLLCQRKTIRTDKELIYDRNYISSAHIEMYTTY